MSCRRYGKGRTEADFLWQRQGDLPSFQKDLSCTWPLVFLYRHWLIGLLYRSMRLLTISNSAATSRRLAENFIFRYGVKEVASCEL